MSDTTGSPSAGAIEAASTWLIVLRDDDVSAAVKAAFVGWLLQSPTHIREFLHCDLVWSWLQDVDWNHVAAAADEGGTLRTGAAKVHEPPDLDSVPDPGHRRSNGGGHK